MPLLLILATARTASKPAACKVRDIGPIRGYMLLERDVLRAAGVVWGMAVWALRGR